MGANLDVKEEKWIKIEKLEEPSSTKKHDILSMKEEDDWRENIKKFLRNQLKIDDPLELRKTKTQSAHY